MNPTRIAVLLSGRGSNFLSIQGAISQGRVPARIVAVISDQERAPGLARARELGLEAFAVPRKGHPSREAHEEKILELLRRSRAEWVCLAGFMRLLTPGFVSRFRQRILNIHPSLLPSFPGLRAQAQALEHGVRVSGCTVHLVDEGLDSGPIVLQKAVEVLPGDGEESLAERILEAEHRAYPEALSLLLTTRWRVQGRRLVLEESPAERGR